MTFHPYEVVGATSHQHREELVKHAAEFRLVRLAKRQHPVFRHRDSRPRGRPDAA